MSRGGASNRGRAEHGATVAPLTNVRSVRRPFFHSQRAKLNPPHSTRKMPPILKNVPHFFLHSSPFALSLLGETTPKPTSATHTPSTSVIRPSMMEEIVAMGLKYFLCPRPSAARAATKVKDAATVVIALRCENENDFSSWPRRWAISKPAHLRCHGRN